MYYISLLNYLRYCAKTAYNTQNRYSVNKKNSNI